MEIEFVPLGKNHGEELCYDVKKTLLGDVLLVWKGDALCGLYFTAVCPIARCRKADLDIDTIRRGVAMGTPFQIKVWKTLLSIPYGTTVSYRWVGEQMGYTRGFQAVGGAVGSNPISLIIPCHRVIASNGALHGYRFGLDLKKRILDDEQKDKGLFIETKLPCFSLKRLIYTK